MRASTSRQPLTRLALITPRSLQIGQTPLIIARAMASVKGSSYAVARRRLSKLREIRRHRYNLWRYARPCLFACRPCLGSLRCRPSEWPHPPDRPLGAAEERFWLDERARRIAR